MERDDFVLSRQRQLSKKEETKKLIVDVARKIMIEEGVQKLSIRKITNELSYSPGIIYHYFKDKNEIVDTILKENYIKILKSLSSVKKYDDNPEKEIKEGLTKYIYTVLEFSEEYKAFILSDKESILQFTGMLYKGVSKDRKSIQLMCFNIEKGIELGIFVDCDVELTAQSIWLSIFGLATRLIIEKNISTDQKEKLITHHIDLIVNGIKK